MRQRKEYGKKRMNGHRSNDDGPRQPSRGFLSRDHGLDRAADKGRFVFVLACTGRRTCVRALTSSDKPKFIDRRRSSPGVVARDGWRHRTLTGPEDAKSTCMASLGMLCSAHGVMHRFQVV